MTGFLDPPQGGGKVQGAQGQGPQRWRPESGIYNWKFGILVESRVLQQPVQLGYGHSLESRNWILGPPAPPDGRSCQGPENGILSQPGVLEFS